MNKVRYFEYFIQALINSYCDANHLSLEQFNAKNDFSKLKVIKLLFFTTASKPELLNVFGNFWAMPYGHVESDIYEALNSLSLFNIDSKSTIMNYNLDKTMEIINGWNLDSIILEEIKSGINYLMNLHNGKLFKYKAMQLVDISHKWYSWKLIYNFARMTNKYSEKIPNELIVQEAKIYSL